MDIFLRKNENISQCKKISLARLRATSCRNSYYISKIFVNRFFTELYVLIYLHILFMIRHINSYIYILVCPQKNFAKLERKSLQNLT